MDYGKLQRLCSKKRLTASHSRSNNTMVSVGSRTKKKMEEKVEQIFDATLGIESGTGKMVFQSRESKRQISKDLYDCLGWCQ